MPKQNEPCDKYEVDLEGEFGACKCGWPAQDHKVKGKNKSKSGSESESESDGKGKGSENVVESTKERGEDGTGKDTSDSNATGTKNKKEKTKKKKPCAKFTPALDGATFNTCTCGFEKAEHGVKQSKEDEDEEEENGEEGEEEQEQQQGEQEQQAGEKPGGDKKEASKQKPKSEEPCDNFQLDMQGEFGHCVCGHSREAHKKAGKLRPPPQPLAMGGIETDKRNTVSGQMQHPGKREKPCAQYEEDVTASAFAMCKCGHPKTKHKQYQFRDKKFNQDFDEDEEEQEQEEQPKEPPKKEIDRSGKNGPCEEFLLDVDGKSGYGYCICGHTRAEHHKSDPTPDEYANVKGKLTKPKPFT